jgi:hypothetical protein
VPWPACWLLPYQVDSEGGLAASAAAPRCSGGLQQLATEGSVLCAGQFQPAQRPRLLSVNGAGPVPAKQQDLPPRLAVHGLGLQHTGLQAFARAGCWMPPRRTPLPQLKGVSCLRSRGQLPSVPWHFPLRLAGLDVPGHPSLVLPSACSWTRLRVRLCPGKLSTGSRKCICAGRLGCGKEQRCSPPACCTTLFGPTLASQV